MRIKNHRRRTVPLIVTAAAGLAMSATPALATPVSANAAAADRSSYLQVYVNNIENLEEPGETCRGNWKALIAYMKKYAASDSGVRPDLFLVQQLGGSRQLKTLLDKMNADLPDSYDGVLAYQDPPPQGSPCGAAKAKQSTAVIYRKARFTVESTAEWQVFSGEKCDFNGQARTRAQNVRLKDNATDKIVNATSMHWPTAASGGNHCVLENANRTVKKVNERGGTLRIWGGDHNTSALSNGTFRHWYNRTNGDRGGAHNYRDAVYRRCSNVSAGLKECLSKNSTAKGRIDYLWAGKADGMPRVSDVHTVGCGEANVAANLPKDAVCYSDHRAIRAKIYY